ncbi:MAG: response regulator [Candidatus Rokubacteria bacterium]|nr:response regulator [Candidatus Rokubacteria bacterium]
MSMESVGTTSPSVLIVEDDVQMRALLKDFLQRQGYRTIERESGVGLTTLVESEPIDAVVLDKEMPGINGLDLLSFLHRRLPDVPVVFVTAFGGRDVAAEALRRGAYRYFEKPFRVAAVVDAIGEAMREPPRVGHAATRP